MMKHAWDGYAHYAWGKNELRPISKVGHASLFGSAPMGSTIIDGLDTLYIMGFMEEFKAGRDWIAENLDMSKMVKIHYHTSLFLCQHLCLNSGWSY